MTRIVAGRAGGRSLAVPPRGTRPTTEKVREALFSLLDHQVGLAGARVLDLFSGSGALALEAVSRGASAVAVESDGGASRVIRANAASLGLDLDVRRARVESFVSGQTEAPFDIVLLDPPYALDSAALAALLGRLEQGGWLATDALVVLERDRRSEPVAAPAAWGEAKVRDYGETRIAIWHT